MVAGRAAVWRSAIPILDIGAALEAGLFADAARDAARPLSGACVNPLLALGRDRAHGVAPATIAIFLRRIAMCVRMASRLLHDAAALHDAPAGDDRRLH